MAFEVPQTGHRRHFYYNTVEGKHFLITSEEDCVRIELQLLITFLKDMQLCVLDDLWTQVGSSAGNSAATSNFNWRQVCLRVSLFVAEVSYDVYLTCLLLCFVSSGITHSVHLSWQLHVLTLLCVIGVIGNPVDGSLARYAKEVKVFISGF